MRQRVARRSDSFLGVAIASLICPPRLLTPCGYVYVDEAEFVPEASAVIVASPLTPISYGTNRTR